MVASGTQQSGTQQLDEATPPPATRPSMLLTAGKGRKVSPKAPQGPEAPTKRPNLTITSPDKSSNAAMLSPAELWFKVLALQLLLDAFGVSRKC